MFVRSVFWLAAICLMIGYSSPGAAQTARPIIAVFDIEDRGAGLSTELVNRLSDFLAMRLASSGSYQVVPRAQLKQRLVQQKKKSYKQCFDQSCQIEIGKDLAAQKSLSTQVAKLGSNCMVTSVLYDLRKSASEGGGSAEGGCSEDEIVKSIKTVLNKLSPPRAAPARRIAPTRPPLRTVRTARRPLNARPAPVVPTRPTVTIDFATQPPGAELFLDGTGRGHTPVRLDLVKGQPYALVLEKKGHRKIQERVTFRERQTMTRKLILTPEGHKLRTEWIGVELLGGIALNGYRAPNGIDSHYPKPTFGGFISACTLKWNYFFWTVGEVGGPLLGTAMNMNIIATRAGFPLYLGDRGAHQLRISVGVALSLIGRTVKDSQNPGYSLEDEEMNVSLIPTLSYTYQTSGRIFFGGKARFYAPLMENWSALGQSYAVTLGATIGLSALR